MISDDYAHDSPHVCKWCRLCGEQVICEQVRWRDGSRSMIDWICPCCGQCQREWCPGGVDLQDLHQEWIDVRLGQESRRFDECVVRQPVSGRVYDARSVKACSDVYGGAAGDVLGRMFET